MQAADIARIVALGAPVLCVDTCTILDLIRDPTRKTVKAHERQASLDLLTAVAGGQDLVVLLAEQVMVEFDQLVGGGQDEAMRAIEDLKAQLRRIDEVAAVYGGVGTANLAHLDDYVTRARAIVDRWISVGTPTNQGAHVPARALARLNEPRTPARRGKDSMKDCVVIETYLDVARALRNEGLARPIVFASSNVKDFAGEHGSTLNDDLAAEFLALSMEYAPNLAAAKHQLGL